MNTHLNLVLNCFAKMDIEGLRLLLKDEFTYSDVPKKAFLERLEALFEEFRVDDPSFSQLQIFPGSCCSLHCDIHLGRTAFRFIGFAGNYFDLRFILEKDEDGQDVIKDIYTCHELLTNERIEEIGDVRFLWVFEDDKVTFKKGPNYQIMLNSALEANSRWIESFENKKIILSDILAWLKKYETTNFDIRDFEAKPDSVWKWDRFLRQYFNLERFINYLEDFKNDVVRLSQLDKKMLDESELITWVLEIEKRMEEGSYATFYGCIFQIDHFGDERKITTNYDINFLLDEDVIAPVAKFLTWFDNERKKLVVKYFSLTQGEVDDFLENNKELDAFHQIGSLLSFHLATRERCRKNGIYIPFDLGGGINPFLFTEVD